VNPLEKLGYTWQGALIAKIRKLQAEVEALRTDAEWQPIETSPKDHSPRLFRVKGFAVQGFLDATGMLCAKLITSLGERCTALLPIGCHYLHHQPKINNNELNH
jgi:hypothetical protein